MTKFLARLSWIADNIAAGMLAVMFVVFLIQIVSRYFMDLSLSWTVELCLTLWLWLVFWVSAFCAKETDHIRFDVLYQSASKRVKRVLGIVTAMAVVIAFSVSLLPTLDYIWFYKIKKSAVMRIPLHYVFSIYGLFLMVIIGRYTWQIWALFRNEEPETEEQGHT